MKKLLRRLFGSAILYALMVTASAFALSGCRSARSDGSGPGAAGAPVREPTPGSSGSSQAWADQASPYHLEAQMRPLTTNSVIAQYDVAVLQAIAQRWYSLLDTSPHVTANGKVVLEFNLRPDGRVPEARIVQRTVDKALASICQKAVLDSAPFVPWPEDMRRALPNDYRAATFTFVFHAGD